MNWRRRRGAEWGEGFTKNVKWKFAVDVALVLCKGVHARVTYFLNLL